MLIGIDPSYAKPIAVSYFLNGVFHHFNLDPSKKASELLSDLADALPPSTSYKVIIEGQQIYRCSPVKTSHILKLSQITGYLKAVFELYTNTKCIEYLPQKWKGSVPPKILMNRVENLVGTLPGNKQSREDFAHSTGLILFHQKQLSAGH